MHIGIVDFAEPTLLIVGDAASFCWLADIFDSRQSLDLSSASIATPVDVNLLLNPVEEGDDLYRDGLKFKWRFSPQKAQEFASQLRALATSSVPAHAYLDVNPCSSGVRIVASKDEYSATKVFIHKQA